MSERSRQRTRRGPVPPALRLVSLAIALFFCMQCAPVDRSKAAIAWRNYDGDDGLGTLRNPGARDLQNMPIEGGTEICAIVVRADGTAKSIWIGTSGPVAFSEDLGETWYTREQFASVGSICIATDGSIYLAWNQDIWRSRDNGSTWESVFTLPANLFNAFPESLCTSGQYLWAVNSSGFALRVNTVDLDSSITWLAGEELHCILPASNGKVYVATRTGIFESCDLGATFSLLMALEPAGNIWHPMNMVEAGDSLWIINDGILQFSFEGTPLWEKAAVELPRSMAAQNGIVWVLEGDEDGGVLEKIVPSPGGNAVEQRSLPEGVSASEASEIFVDADGYIYLGLPSLVAVSTDDGASWNTFPIATSAVNQIAADRGSAWAHLESGLVAKLPAGASTWEIVDPNEIGLRSLTGWIYCDRVSNRIIMSGNSPYVAITTDNGLSFDQHWFGQQEGEAYACTTICGDSAGKIYLSVVHQTSADECRKECYRSDDAGTSWSAPAVVNTERINSSNSTVCISEKMQLMLFTAGSGVFQSDLTGTNWQKLEAFQQAEPVFINALGDAYVFAKGPSGRGLYTLNDVAEGWRFRKIDHVFDNDGSISFGVDNDGGLWRGSDNGIHYSSDGGASWVIYTTEDGLATNYIYCVTVEGSGDDKTVWLGTILGVSKGTFPAISQ